MASIAAPGPAAPAPRRFRLGLSRRSALYLLLLPGLAWLVVFYVYPAIQMFLVSLWTGNITAGYEQTFNWSIYAQGFGEYWPWMLRSAEYGGVAAVPGFLPGLPPALPPPFYGG